MSADPKVRAGATEWRPQGPSRHLADEHVHVGPAAIPPQPTRVHVPTELYAESSQPDSFVDSNHFKFIAQTLAQGQVPNYTAMYREGHVFGVEDVTGALMQESVRTALVAEVAKRSNGRVTLVPSTPDDLGGVRI